MDEPKIRIDPIEFDSVVYLFTFSHKSCLNVNGARNACACEVHPVNK
jgi:hypothetical protein